MKKLKYLFLIIMVTFFTSASFVSADTIYMEFKDGNDSTVCGSSNPNLSCQYYNYSTGAFKTIDGYVIILEDLNLKAKTTYTLSMRWDFNTVADENDYYNYISQENYTNFSSSITPRYSTGSGTIIPDNNRTWRVVSSSLFIDNSVIYANFNYSYSNTFTPTTNINRLVFRISKRSRWSSMGLSPSADYPIDSTISIKNLEWTISSDNTDAIITNQNQNTQDIINSQNNNTDKITDSIDKIDDVIISESDNFEDSSCGVICKLKKLPQAILDGLKSLFIPEDGYFEDWFNELKLFFEEKLGFLSTPFTIFIDFVNMYLSLDASIDIIINIPDITVPNFEEYKIISATSFNWSELLRSKDSFNSLWQLYLSFIDVYLILNFIGLCESKYNRIFGGDTSTYEYYTVEDSVSYDGQTGEVTSRRQNERTTTKRRV